MIADLDSLGSKKLTYKYLYKFEFAQLSFMISQSQYPVFKVQRALTRQCSVCAARGITIRETIGNVCENLSLHVIDTIGEEMAETKRP